MDLTQLIAHPELMDKETLYDLRSLIALYPYHQTARLLMLQNLYLLHDSSFDEELRRAAIYITDRNKIFDLVEAAHYRIKPAAKASDTQAKKAEDGKSRTISLIDDFLGSIPEETQTEETKVPKRKPTPADAAIDYVAYLLETESEEEQNAEAEQQPKMKGQSLIDDFINKDGGKIVLKDEPEYLPAIETKQDTENANDGIFTETLANIYIKQGRYSKALEIIQRLNLNYPKKNAYFADQIRFLEKLILNSKINNKQK